MTEVLDELGADMSIPVASSALGVPRSTAYRWQKATRAEKAQVRGAERERVESPGVRSPRALSPEEKDLVLEHLRSERFADKAPAQVHATLLEEGVFLCSERTMYRILEEKREVRERRVQLIHPRCVGSSAEFSVLW